MVLETIRQLCTDRYGCEAEEVVLAATLDELNLTPDERDDLTMTLTEAYGVPVPEEAQAAFATIEDVVGYIEDRL